MNDWYRLIFSADDIAAAKHLEMEGHFERFFLAAGSPEDAALFRQVDAGRTIYYFSPGAAKIATIPAIFSETIQRPETLSITLLNTHLRLSSALEPVRRIAILSSCICPRGDARSLPTPFWEQRF
jgi:hypothetical protein